MKNLYWILGAVTLTLMACSKGKDASTSEAENDINASSDQTAADLSSNFECDGKGKDYSGEYSFSLLSGQGKCADNHKDIELLPMIRTYLCEQKDKDLECKLKRDGTQVLKGCVSKDGKFKLSADSDMGYLASQIVTVGAESGKDKVTMVGTLDQKGGKARFSTLAQRGDAKKGCVFNWELETEKMDDMDTGVPEDENLGKDEDIASCQEFLSSLEGDWTSMSFEYDEWKDMKTEAVLTVADLKERNIAPLTWYQYDDVSIEIDDVAHTLKYTAKFSEDSFSAITTIAARDSETCQLIQMFDEQQASSAIPEGDVIIGFSKSQDLKGSTVTVPMYRTLASNTIVGIGNIILKK